MKLFYLFFSLKLDKRRELNGIFRWSFEVKNISRFNRVSVTRDVDGLTASIYAESFFYLL